MQDERILAVSNITRAYRAGMPGCGATIEVLRGMSLEMRAGDFVHIEGERGAGKTTLLLCAAGLLRPDSGAVIWPVLAPRTTQAPSTVRYVGDRAPTYGFLTVRESLAYATTVREIEAPGLPAPDDDLLDVAGLRALTGTRVSLLTRGERARFLVALAVAASPRLLVVDDVSADCDDTSWRELCDTLIRISRKGIAVLWASRRPAPSQVESTFRLVRGRLRSCDPTERCEAVPVPPPHPVVQPSVKHLPRVAEP